MTATITQRMGDLSSLSSFTIGPYTGISRETMLEFPEVGRKFRLAIYAAFNAYGLIGSESNGIVLLDEDKRMVVLDEHFQEPSGYFGPTIRQIDEFERITKLDWKEFCEFVSQNPRSRPRVVGGVFDYNASPAQPA